MLNTIKCEALAVVIAILLASWLIGGCKEAVGPIQPVQVHHHEEDEEAEETRRELPPPPKISESRDSAKRVDKLDEALKLVENPDPKKKEKGINNLGQLLATGTPTQRRASQAKLRELLHSSNASLRRQAASALGRRFEQTYPLLLEALNDKDTSVLIGVLHVLSQHAGKPSLIRRVRELLNHPDYRVSSAAVSALLEMYSRSKDVAGLINLLGVSEHDLSAKAAIKLSVMGRETVPELIRALKTSTNADQRHGAALVLSMICGGTSVKQRRFAELAQAEQLPAYQKAPPLPDRRAVEPLIDALRHDDSAKVREISAQGLGYLGDARAAPALAEALTKDPSETVRRRAAAALITVPAHLVRRDLEQAARNDESAAVRRYAAEALGWIGSPLVVPALIDVTKDEAPEVRRYAAIQLGRFAEEEKLSEKLHNQVLLALINLFDDEDSDVRWAAVMSIGKLRDRATVGLLAKALDDPVPMVSHAAERGLQKLGLAERKAEEFEK